VDRFHIRLNTSAFLILEICHVLEAPRFLGSAFH
jgi:hypothetical protein